MSLSSVMNNDIISQGFFKENSPLVTRYERLNEDREIEAFYKTTLHQKLLLVTTVTLIFLTKEMITKQLQQFRFHQSNIFQVLRWD